MKTKFIKTIGIISELLIFSFEEHAVDVIKYEGATSSESLTSFAAYTFIPKQLLVGSKRGTLLGLTATTATEIQITQYNSERPTALDRTLCKAAKHLAKTSAESLRNVMEQLTVVLFDFYQQKDQARKSKVKIKAIEEHHKLREDTE